MSIRRKNLKCFRGFINCIYISHILYITPLEEHKNVNISWLFPLFHLKQSTQSPCRIFHQVSSVTEDSGLRQNKITVIKSNLQNYRSLTVLLHSIDLFSIATEQNNLYIQSH